MNEEIKCMAKFFSDINMLINPKITDILNLLTYFQKKLTF